METTRNNRTILLVEDNADDEVLTLRALKKSKIENRVYVVRDGPEALDFLFGTGAYAGKKRIPAVVLLDLKLPKIDGLEVLRRIRAEESTRMIPIVVLTSSREEQDMVRSYRNGANSYIRKPVEFERFVEAVGQIGSYWLSLNELPPTTKG